jgi:acyl carrier protein
MAEPPAMERLLTIISSIVPAEHEIVADTPLISSALIDSFDLIALVVEIEAEFEIVLPIEEVSVESFDTPVMMLRWIQEELG